MISGLGHWKKSGRSSRALDRWRKSPLEDPWERGGALPSTTTSTNAFPEEEVLSSFKFKGKGEQRHREVDGWVPKN